MKDDCIFCKLANGVFATRSIYEDEDFNVILDLAPATKGHALVESQVSSSLGFQASRSNSIYGSSTTVTPLSLQVFFLIKYI